MGLILVVYVVSIAYYTDYYDAQQSAANSVNVYISIVASSPPNGTASYSPNAFRVAEGERVTLVVSNGNQVTHGLAIPAFDVNTGAIPAGNTVKVTFTPDRTGTFTFDEPPGSCAASGGVCDSSNPMAGNMTVLARPR